VPANKIVGQFWKCKIDLERFFFLP
jgi:hypothetical protein